MSVSRPLFRTKAAWGLLAVPVALAATLIWLLRPGVTKPRESIFEAAGNSDIIAVQAHIATGTSVNSLSDGGHTALYTAAGNGDVAVVKYLLEHGASPNAESNGKDTPLEAAALAGNLQIVQMLIEHGADLHPPSNGGETPLHAAAAGGNADIVSLFIDKGLDVNAVRSTDHATPVCEAASVGSWPCIDVLLQHRASIDIPGFHGRPPVSLAILRRHGKLARQLIRAGADVNIADEDGNKPIDFALVTYDIDLAKTLLPMTKDLNRYRPDGRNLLYDAVYYAAPNDFIQTLIDKGVDPNQHTKGDTPLAIATTNKDQALITILKKAGAKR